MVLISIFGFGLFRREDPLCPQVGLYLGFLFRRQSATWTGCTVGVASKAAHPLATVPAKPILRWTPKMGLIPADSLRFAVPGLLARRSRKDFLVLSDEFSLFTTIFALPALIVLCKGFS